MSIRSNNGSIISNCRDLIFIVCQAGLAIFNFLNNLVEEKGRKGSNNCAKLAMIKTQLARVLLHASLSS